MNLVDDFIAPTIIITIITIKKGGIYLVYVIMQIPSPVLATPSTLT